MTRTADAATIAEGLADVVRTAARAKARRQQQTPGAEVEWAASVVLRTLQAHGPMRLSELAEHVHSDLSTLSRQVATMVKDGLLERRADPDDGRSSVLVPTASGHDYMTERMHVRNDYFGRMLADWSPADLATFAALFERFSADYRVATAAWADPRPAAVTA